MDEMKLAQAISAGIVAGLQQNGSNGTGYGTKAPIGAPTAVGWMHGVGGIFGIPGLDEQVISARITPRGISTVLRVFPDIYTHPQYPYITGVVEMDAEEPQTECETCPSGVTQSCIQSACFGFICRETRELTPNRAIERINSGEVNLTLVNDILGLDQGDPFLAIRQYDRGTIMQIATAWAMLEVGILIQQKLVPMVWTGNPANNIGTGYREFNGLDVLISANKRDWHTGARCAALDSDVKNFAYQNINAVDAQGNFTIVRQLSALEAYVYHNAVRMNLMPCEWVWVMKPELWYELTEIWPIIYYTTRNMVAWNLAGNVMNLSAKETSDLRDNMRSGMYLYVNGRRHPVILDDGVADETNADVAAIPVGSVASNIYFVPLKYLGSRDATYLQHKDYRLTGPELRAARLTPDQIWSDDGRFLWTNERMKWCYTLSAKIEPRIVLKTPQIAGRLNNVVYTPEQRLRSPFQDDLPEDYPPFLKGGEMHRAFPFGRVYPPNAPVVGVVPTTGTCDE